MMKEEDVWELTKAHRCGSDPTSRDGVHFPEQGAWALTMFVVWSCRRSVNYDHAHLVGEQLVVANPKKAISCILLECQCVRDIGDNEINLVGRLPARR